MEESEDRRKRLKLLREKRDANKDKSNDNESSNQSSQFEDTNGSHSLESNEKKEKKLVFRNYRPVTVSNSSVTPVNNFDESNEKVQENIVKRKDVNMDLSSDVNGSQKIIEKTESLENTPGKSLSIGQNKYESITSTDSALILKEELEKEMKRSSNGIQSKAEFEKSLMPNKINWDLKRGVEKRLADLEKRTEKAIIELLREKLEAEESTDDDSDDSGDDENSDID